MKSNFRSYIELCVLVILLITQFYFIFELGVRTSDYITQHYKYIKNILRMWIYQINKFAQHFLVLYIFLDLLSDYICNYFYGTSLNHGVLVFLLQRIRDSNNIRGDE